LTVAAQEAVAKERAVPLLSQRRGAGPNPAPRTGDENPVRVANLSNSVVAELRMVHNQPMAQEVTG
jgi:hypothetical protein